MKSVLHNSLRWGIALLMMLCTYLQASAQLRGEQADSCFQVYYPLSRTHIQEEYLKNRFFQLRKAEHLFVHHNMIPKEKHTG